MTALTQSFGEALFGGKGGSISEPGTGGTVTMLKPTNPD